MKSDVDFILLMDLRLVFLLLFDKYFEFKMKWSEDGVGFIDVYFDFSFWIVFIW